MRDETFKDYRRRIDRVVETIRSNLTVPYTVTALADVANFSPFHFHRIYRAMTGEGISETIRSLRLGKAAFLLASSARKVTEIALDVGYESGQSFARAFRDFTTLSPTQFRRQRCTLAELVPGVAPAHETRRPGVDVKIMDQPGLRAHVILNPAGGVIQETYRRLWQWQVNNGLAGRAEYAIGICYGDPEGGDNFRYYAGVVYPEPVAASGEVELHMIPGGHYGVYRHVGPYTEIGALFKRLYGSWLPSSGFDPDDRPALEIYRNNPYTTPANALETDLLIPVK